MKKVLLFLLLALAISAHAVMPEPTALRVVPTTGDPLVISFGSKPELVFTPGGVRIVSEDPECPVSFDFEGIEFVDFTSESGVGQVAAPEISLVITPGTIEISNLPDESVVDLYALDGRNVFHAKVSGICSIDRSKIARGIYVLSINKNVFKISI